MTRLEQEIAKAFPLVRRVSDTDRKKYKIESGYSYYFEHDGDHENMFWVTCPKYAWKLAHAQYQVALKRGA